MKSGHCKLYWDHAVALLQLKCPLLGLASGPAGVVLISRQMRGGINRVTYSSLNPWPCLTTGPYQYLWLIKRLSGNVGSQCIKLSALTSVWPLSTHHAEWWVSYRQDPLCGRNYISSGWCECSLCMWDVIWVRKTRVRGGVLKKEVGSMLNKLIKLNKTRWLLCKCLHDSLL